MNEAFATPGLAGQVSPGPHRRQARHTVPGAGLLADIMAHHRVRAAETLLVGEEPSDQEAARRTIVRFRRALECFAREHQAS